MRNPGRALGLFGAALASAIALTSCGGDDDDGGDQGGAAGAAAGEDTGGSSGNGAVGDSGTGGASAAGGHGGSGGDVPAGAAGTGGGGPAMGGVAGASGGGAATGGVAGASGSGGVATGGSAATGAEAGAAGSAAAAGSGGQGPHCGDGVCDDDETCQDCFTDCGICAGVVPEFVGVAGSTIKFRPDSAVPDEQHAQIDAARNEFEPFQVVISCGDSGVELQAAALSALSSGDDTIATDQTIIYREELFYVPSASNLSGDAGYWPDPMIPNQDRFYHETRNAFPWTIPAGEVRAVWVDVYVPEATVPGSYQGQLTLTFDSGEVDVPVSLRVRSFTLPSTATLRSAYGIGWNAPCVAHHGSYEACGSDAGVEHYHPLYAKLALDHRISLETVVYYYPSSDWEHFDEVYGPLLDGTTDTILPGAQLTTLRVYNDDVDQLVRIREHFEAQGWDAATKLFQYTCDEPPAGCAWEDIPALAANAQAAGIPSLVTDDISEATDHGVLDAIDILTPLMNYMHADEPGSERSEYDTWLAQPGKDLWWYISCMSHGCGEGCDTSTGEWTNDWPDYIVDASAIQARSLEWLSFAFDVSGELYYESTYSLATAWDDQCAFSSAGDGNLFYPGTPDRIGGTEHIPVASLRMKLIREGMEDYEYLHLLASLGEEAMARSEAESVFGWHAVTQTTPAQLMAARQRLADRIDALQ